MTLVLRNCLIKSIYCPHQQFIATEQHNAIFLPLYIDFTAYRKVSNLQIPEEIWFTIVFYLIKIEFENYCILIGKMWKLKFKDTTLFIIISDKILNYKPNKNVCCTFKMLMKEINAHLNKQTDISCRLWTWTFNTGKFFPIPVKTPEKFCSHTS